MSVILSVNQLNVFFKSDAETIHAVKNVDFELNKADILGIVGESGSGKSVTSLAVMGLVAKANGRMEGEIWLQDNQAPINLLALTEEEIRKYRGKRIAMIFQEPMTSLNPVLTCGYQVAEAIQLHFKVNKAESRKKTIELFKEVQLPRPEQLFDTYPHQISGGQKQRVMIAMALSCNPEILIADEPTTALDVTVQKTILELLLQLRKDRGMSMLFISHDLGVIADIADKVLVMYKGEIVEKGTVEDVFKQPKHAYTKGLLSCRPASNSHLKLLPTVSDFMIVSEDGSIQETDLGLDNLQPKFGYASGEREKRKESLLSQKSILKVENLKTWFPVQKGIFSKTKEFVKAVDDVSFQVYPGETLGLVGESGCGKTTLGRSILRLVEPTAGKIIFDAADITGLNTSHMRDMRKNMQIIFQDPYSSLNPRLTVGESILEPMRVHKMYSAEQERKQVVLRLLDRVNLLPQHFDRYPHEFSGGQRQRICIARALALQPKFIICDESVSALDVSVQAQVLNLLVELREEFNLTYIFISHDLSVVRFISDRIMVMNKGKIEEIGTADAIYNHPQSDYTQKLLAAIPGNKVNITAI